MGIAGGADNDLGMAGFAFEATLWPIQANSGPGTALGGISWARAIDWVRTADSGGRRKVIILEVQTASFGNYEMVPSVNAAIRYAIANGVVVCVAAGNGDRDAGVDDLGNAIPETGSILVGATAYDPAENRRAGFSNYGPRIVVSAPGDGGHDVTCDSSSDSAYRNNFGGTSGATPKVAATAALMLAGNPALTHEEIRTILNSTGSAVVTEGGKPVGTFLDSEAAVLAALPTESAVFVHRVTAQNISNIFPCTTYVDHPLTNGNPNAILFVTHNWNPLGMPSGQGQFNNHPIGVWYDEGPQQQWAIYNEDEEAMVEGVAFNVSVYSQPFLK